MKIRVNRVFLEDDEREDRTHLLTGCASSEYKRKRPLIPCNIKFQLYTFSIHIPAYIQYVQSDLFTTTVFPVIGSN